MSQAMPGPWQKERERNFGLFSGLALQKDIASFNYEDVIESSYYIFPSSYAATFNGSNLS